MTLAITGRGQHRPSAIISRLRHQVRRLDRDNTRLVAGIEDREREIHTALVRGCQDAALVARLKEQLADAEAGIRKFQGDLIRAKAEQERLRQAVINARPQITETVQRLDRPYVSYVQIPYPVPVGRSTANEETQELPVIDHPEHALPGNGGAARVVVEALTAPCPECLMPVPAGTTYCSARCRNAADSHDDMGDL